MLVRGMFQAVYTSEVVHLVLQQT